MESDIERSIILRDAERIVGGDHVQGSNVAAVLNPSGSTVKISSLSIDLGIVKEKGDTQTCSHFSIRGYAAKMRERGGNNNYLKLADGSGEVVPMEVPHFRYWLCQSCLQDSRGGSTSQEVAIVSQYGKSMVQPCASSYSHRLPITLPFGEGSSGLKPAEKKNDDESILADLRGNTTQSSPDDIHEPPKTDSIDTNIADEANVDVDDSAIQSEDPSGHLRRKARKVRLLTDLLCGSKEEHHQRKESTEELSPNSSSPLTSSSQIKRKIPQTQSQPQPQAQDRRSSDVNIQGHVGKKAKVFKGDAAIKTSVVEHSRDLGAGNRKKNATQRSSKPGKVSSDPLAPWRSIISDIGRSSHDGPLMPPPQPEKKSNGPKKMLENQLFGDVGGSGIRDGQSDTGLGLGLSLHYGSSLPPMPNQDHSRKSGFFFGDSNMTHRFTSDPQPKATSVYQVRDGCPPRTPFHQPYYAHLSHGNFSQHQNLDFSDPHNKRNGGVKGYSDVHQRQEIFSNGRSDEKEIVELMAKIQHERNLSDARSFRVPGGSNSSSFRKVNFNQGIQQYPAMRPHSINPSAFFHHQDPPPAYPSFHTFPQFQKQPSNGIQISDQRRQASPTNMQIMESFNKYRGGNVPPGNTWSNVGQSVDMHRKWSNGNKGKSVVNLDLNLTASNLVDDLEVNPKHMGSLDSNEAIPAMQLLSLMDAGKSNSGKKITPHIPFSCYNHGGKPNSMEGRRHFPYSGVQKPVENARHVVFGHGTSSSPFSPLFHTNQTSQLKKPRGMTSASVYHTPDSFVFSLPPASRNVTSGTEVCTTNRNPADFSVPGPQNAYMISYQDLKFKFASENNGDGQNRQRKVIDRNPEAKDNNRF